MKVIKVTKLDKSEVSGGLCQARNWSAFGACQCLEVGRGA